LRSEDDDHLWEPFNAEVLARHDIQISPDELEELADGWSGDSESDGEGGIDLEKHMSKPNHAEDIQQMKWKNVRDAILPEPDNMTEVDYVCKESIREKFKATGLQVIVKMATIELTPEKPDFPMGGWHVSFLDR
jgi:hypothetical protein